jgi:TetR/AcrR family transcriptional regulator, cholesterol catabolism regulator
VLQDCFRLTEHDIQRNRVLVAEQGLLMNPRESPHEEQARQAARERTRELERVWAAFLADGMEQGAIPRGDPRLLARAILGFYCSVWHWYRPDGTTPLPRVAEFFVARSLALAGVAPDVAESVLAA